MTRILIIGGTGMLRDATDYFIRQDYDVSIMARDLEKLNYFKTQYPAKNIHLISQDYADTDRFIATIHEQKAFDIIVCWIHGSAKKTLQQLVDTLSATKSKTIFYHLKGSASYDPTKTTSLENTSAIDYREIILGFQIEREHSRWLTNDEIANGTIHAVTHDLQKHVIGVTEPWDQRP